MRLKITSLLHVVVMPCASVEILTHIQLCRSSLYTISRKGIIIISERGVTLLRVVKASHGFSTLPACKMEAKTDVNIPGILKDIHL